MDFTKCIINEWDPVGLLSHSPEDEYCVEIDKIQALLCMTDNLLELTEGIYALFVESFGKEAFNKSKEECYQIAELLLSQKC